MHWQMPTYAQVPASGEKPYPWHASRQHLPHFEPGGEQVHMDAMQSSVNCRSLVSGTAPGAILSIEALLCYAAASGSLAQENTCMVCSCTTSQSRLVDHPSKALHILMSLTHTRQAPRCLTYL